MALLALVLGVVGAVYFQGSGPGSAPQVAANAPSPSPASPPVATSPVAPSPQAIGPPENKPQDQGAVSPESNLPSPTATAPQTAQAPAPMANDAGKNLSQIQTSNALPSPDNEASRLAQISPTAAPANVAVAAPRYWVEFGAYDTSYYADRLKQSLGQLGIDATIANVPGKDGRTYLRVRTSGDSDRGAATAQLSKAQSALRISPLLHRAAAISPAPTRAPEAQAKPVSSGGYWVQFGAFRERQNAEVMLSQLRKTDIQATVIERKSSANQPLYLVRIAGLSDRAQAVQTAHRGNTATRASDAFIGQDRASASPPNPDLNPRQPTR
jgi:cell division protein FtsN